MSRLLDYIIAHFADESSTSVANVRHDRLGLYAVGQLVNWLALSIDYALWLQTIRSPWPGFREALQET